MNKKRTLSQFKQQKTFNHGSLDLTMERFELDSKDLEAKVIQSSIESSVETEPVKNPFWNSLKDRLGKHEESLPEMIDELSVKEEATQLSYPAPLKANISASMIVHGNLETESAISIRGTVFGDVRSQDVVDARHDFRIHGEVSAESLYTFGGHITGDIDCVNKVEIGEDSVVFGHIKARHIVVTGRVEGNLEASQSVRLTSTAVVHGNLSAASFSVEAGALLSGNCEVKLNQKD